MSKRTGLGKGLGALFGEEYTDNKTPVVKEEGGEVFKYFSDRAEQQPAQKDV